MAEPTGTARQEAEKLVATVLAMASQAGLGGPPKGRDPAAPTGPTGPTGLTGLTDRLSGLMDQFLGGTPDNQPAGPSETTDRDHPTDPREADPGVATDSREAGSAESDQPGFDWREAYQHTLDSLGAQARQAAGRQLWAGATRFGGWSTGSAECCMCPINALCQSTTNNEPSGPNSMSTGR